MTDDHVERVARAICVKLAGVAGEFCHIGKRQKDAARAAIAECFKWRAIEEYDAMKRKPDNCVFWVEASINSRRSDLSMSACMSLSRTMGSRRTIGYIPLPEPPKENAP